MGFRERPEYQGWREAVFQLFGQKCIRCGYTGNLHAHHVMPVNEYPELAFEPTNGVPLCGNCHSEVNGNELAHVDDLKRRQCAILGAETAAVAKDVPSEPALRERAYAEPSNAQAVQAWFEVADVDVQAVADFYDKHREDSTQTAWLCGYVMGRLTGMARWQDVIAVADKAMEITEREGTLEESVERIASVKSMAMRKLGRLPESVAYLRQFVGRFPKLPALHSMLSESLLGVLCALAKKDCQEAKDAIEESVHHALEAAQLAPGVSDYASSACFILSQKGDYPTALQYGKRAYALASDNVDKVDALQKIAWVYARNDLYSDARSYLREALQIDDCNVRVIADIAHCLFMEDNQGEAIRMAKRGLMLDPSDEECQKICAYCGCRD